jgi:hypothetical protein
MIQYPSDIESSRNQMFINCHGGVEAKWVMFYEKQKLGIPGCAGAVEELGTPYHNILIILRVIDIYLMLVRVDAEVEYDPSLRTIDIFLKFFILCLPVTRR